MNTANDWTARWVASKIRDGEGVESVDQIASNVLVVTRASNPPITVVTMAEKGAVTSQALTELIKPTDGVNFVVNVPKDSFLTGGALRCAARNSFGIGGLGDLIRAITMPDVTRYVPKTIEFIERGLRQHTRVADFERLADLHYVVRRTGGLADVHVVFLPEYELVAEHVRVARERYGEFDMVVITNPSGNTTNSANALCEELGCRVYRWGDFLGALHRR
jgi:hypothetical protein